MEFNRQQFIAAIGASPQETPHNFHIFETVASTNQTLWQLLEEDAPPQTVVIATQQTSGRGQWGRHWQSGLGGLYLSLALSPNVLTQFAAGLTLCTAWGIATALRDKGIPALLKWPNDLVLSGRKLGGILTETKVQQGKIAKAVVGVGINWANSVPETGINLQSWLENNPISSITSLEILAAVTFIGIVSGYEYWQQKGIEHLLPAYENLLTNMGQKVTVDGQAGAVVGVGANGDLRVQICQPGVAKGVEISLEPGTISLGYR